VNPVKFKVVKCEVAELIRQFHEVDFLVDAAIARQAPPQASETARGPQAIYTRDADSFAVMLSEDATRDHVIALLEADSTDGVAFSHEAKKLLATLNPKAKIPIAAPDHPEKKEFWAVAAFVHSRLYDLQKNNSEAYNAQIQES
jgi:hypothetical protein